MIGEACDSLLILGCLGPHGRVVVVCTSIESGTYSCPCPVAVWDGTLS
jgi:hypothetical protein